MCEAPAPGTTRSLRLALVQSKNLETLKMRFGEQALQGCEVMLKDLQDSKQLDASVHALMPVRLSPAALVKPVYTPAR